MGQQRPRGWYHWAEVVWNSYRTPAFIGDMPHTWVGSDFVNSFRNIFVYENPQNSNVCIGAGLKQEWIDSQQGIKIENLPTYHGTLSYSINRDNDHYSIKIWGNIKLPKNGICLKNFNAPKVPERITVNGVEIQTYNEKEINVNEFPCEINIYY